MWMMKPIIIIGMHRSGTSLLSNILQKLGICMGKDIVAHEESHSFQKINLKIFELFHASWDWPSPLQEFNKLEPSLGNMIVEYFQEKISTKKFAKEFGVDIFNKFDSFFGRKYKVDTFGWKDPRNTYTLPIWLKIFPDAKVIHIHRNGIDVAESLKEREEARINKGFDNNSLLSLRCLSLYGGFSLWEEYVQKANSYRNVVRNDNFLSVSYESLLEQPFVELADIMSFLGIKGDGKFVEDLSTNLNKHRMYSFLKCENLRKFYFEFAKHNAMMSMLHYNRIIESKLEQGGE